MRTGALVEPTVDTDAMIIRDSSGVRWTLDELHDRFLDVPKRERLAFVREHVRQAARGDDMPTSWDVARELVVPEVCGRAGALPNRRLAPGLHATIVATLPLRTESVTDELLATWNVSFDEALVAAHRNLVYRGHPILPLSPGCG